MKDREEEYKKIFVAETNEEYEKISALLVDLERNPSKNEIIHEIFRLLHNLKANAKAMGYTTLSETAHKLENIFSQLRDGVISFKGVVVDFIYKGVDYMGFLINHLDNEENQQPDKAIFNELDLIFSNKLEELSAYSGRKYNVHNLSISDSVNIPLKKLDSLLNSVGELVIERDQLINYADSTGSNFLMNLASRLNRIANEMQENIMSSRLVSVISLFNKFPRIIRDVSVAEGKEVNFTMTGHDTKVDRNILSIITDTMLHLIRNGISHGIESPEERKKVNKNPEGKLSINASSEKGHINIIVSDDGRGIDTTKLIEKAVEKGIISEKSADKLSHRQALMLIFQSGFSMADKITELSGRGVGLDIVKNVIDSIGGDIKVSSEVGKGTSFQLSLPISIAVKTALLFKVRTSYFALPLLNINAVINLNNESIHEIDGNLVTDIENETIPLIYLNDFLFEMNEKPIGKTNIQRKNMDVILLSYGNRKFGLIVDELVTQQEVVIKPLQQPLDRHDLFSGMTLVGSGEVCFVLDISALVKLVEIEEVL